MGRPSSGAHIVEVATKINLSLLLKKGYFRKGHCSMGTLTWTNGCKLQATSVCDGDERYLHLAYTSKGQGETFNHSYKIRLAAKPSNLGKGEVLYFVCPQTNRLCRCLFFSPLTRTFVGRKAYPFRLFYRSQTSSKLSIANDRYWSIKRILEDLAKRKETFSYNGKKTRYAFRVERLLEKQDMADYLRWMPQSMPHSLRRHFQHLQF